jgi:hypothetical protein
MIFSWPTHETGKVRLGSRFVSLRLIKDAIEKHNKISVLEETPTWLKCRVFRIARLFGGPWIGPYPILCFRIERGQGETVIHYDFYWPEYHAVLICSAALGFVTGYFENTNADLLSKAKFGLLVFLIGVLFAGFFIFLDIKYYSRILHKELKGL